ncbi:MAG: hypothetical protein LBU77_01670, partial [Clostridiales bacterium]|nr:hypothetical protein [Clostridiales bacterium]
SVQQILTLDPGESKDVSFSFAPNAVSKTQNYSIEFKIDYENGVENETDTGTVKETDSFVQYASVDIVNTKADEEADEDDDKKTKSLPKIIVSKYKADPAIVQAGQEFSLDLTFQNTHSTKSVHNIKALLTVPLNQDGEKTVNVFSPIDASNTFFVDSIAPKGTSDQYIRLSTVPDAVAKNYVLVIQFDYEDADGNQITQTEEVGVNVRQTAQLELGEIPMPTNGIVEQPMEVGFSVQNTGQMTLNNLKVKITGENFRTSDAEVIFGNFKSGQFDDYYGTFVPTAAGEQKVQVVVSYDEETGEHVEKTEEFTILVEEMQAMEDPRGDMMMNPDGVEIGPDGMPIEGESGGIIGFLQNNWIWIVAAGAVVVIAAVAAGIVIVRKRRKDMDLDE